MLARQMLLLLLPALTVSKSPNLRSSSTCPPYSSILQPSMSTFNLTSYLTGLYYMVATTEPTMPSFCKCGRNNYTLNTQDQTYGYTNFITCPPAPEIEVHVGGVLSEDPGTPGYLRENAVILGHQVTPYDPNMVFHVGYDDCMVTLACLSRGRTSLNVLCRTSGRSRVDIEDIIRDVEGMIPEGLTEGIMISSAEDYDNCNASSSDGQ